MKGRYVEYANKIKAIAEELISLAKEVDPVLSLRAGYKTHNSRAKMEELYNMMKAGTTINKELVEQTYPELEPYVVSNIMQRLKKFKGVEQRKVGNKLNLYVRG